MFTHTCYRFYFQTHIFTVIYGGPERSNVLMKTAANRKVPQNTRTTTEIEKYTANAHKNQKQSHKTQQKCF